jgi:hypothetical protein
MKLSNKTYNVLKSVALVWLPALTGFYFVLSGILGFTHTAQVMTYLTAIDTCLGILLKASTDSYKAKQPSDGQMVVDTSNPLKDTFTLALDIPASSIAGKDKLVLEVTQADKTPAKV